jgi:DNA helicase HerA-like ATPase
MIKMSRKPIGKVINVTYDRLLFDVTNFENFIFNEKGKTYSVDGVGDFVTVIDDRNVKFIYQIVKIFDKEIILTNEKNSKVNYNGNFECIPIGIINENKLKYYFDKYPFLRNNVYLTNETEMNIMFEGKAIQNEIKLGKYRNLIECKIDMDKFFSNHSAILGNTGSGKSNTIKSLIHGFSEKKTTNVKVHILDYHNEFVFKDEYCENIDVKDEYKIAINELELQDWINLLKPSNLVQQPILEMALKLSIYLSDFDFEEALRCFLALQMYRNVQTDVVSKRTKILNILSGTDVDVTRYDARYANFEGQYEQHFISSLTDKIDSYFTQETSFSSFDDFFSQNTDYKTNSFENLLKSLEFTFYMEESKGNNQVRSHCKSLETRVRTIDSKYSQILVNYETEPSDTEKKITKYNVSNLDDDILLFFSSFILKKEFEKSKSGDRDRINFFIFEEAHKYISKVYENSNFNELEIFNKIAREGRKFGCLMLLSSQRPSELSSTVMSQCNNYFLHRIKNNFDLDYIAKSVPYIDHKNISRLSYLPTGTTFLVGEITAFPVEVAVLHDTNNSNSNNIIVKYEN